MFISVPFEQIDEKPFSVKADEFYKVLKALKSKECTFSVKDDSLILKTNDTESKIAINTDNESSLQEIKESIDIDNIEFVELNDPETFVNSIYMTSFVAAKEITDECIFCVNVTPEHIQGTDSYRISHCEIDEPDIEEFLIPASVAVNLKNYEIFSVGFSEEWVHFMTETGAIISCRIVQGEYPDLEDVLGSLEADETINLPEELADDLKDVAFMCKGEYEIEKTVQILKEKDILTLKAEKDTGYIKKKYEFDEDIKPFEIHVNPIFLHQTLKNNNEMTHTDDFIAFISDKVTNVLAIATQDEE